MKASTAICVFIGLAIGNFLYEFFNLPKEKNQSRAMDRTFFQFVAVFICYFVTN